jgi:hypothetical protein
MTPCPSCGKPRPTRRTIDPKKPCYECRDWCTETHDEYLAYRRKYRQKMKEKAA